MRISGLNWCPIAIWFLLFHICWKHNFLGKRSKPFFLISNQWSTMQYSNFVSKKNLFSTVSIYGLLFLRGFWRLLINCLIIKRSIFSPWFLHIFSLQLSLRFSLWLTVQIVKIVLVTLKISFLLFFHNLLFQDVLINLAGKEFHVLLNI